jgi:hypothetical protein
VLVVGAAFLQFPPLPDGDPSIPAVEAQLLGLVATAYPLRLLNLAGQ